MSCIFSIKLLLNFNSTIDIKNIEDQLDSSKYFTQTNNDNYLSNDIIAYNNVVNKDQCIDSCVRDYKNCKSVIYMEQPKSCTFYNGKKMKNKHDNIRNYKHTIYNLDVCMHNAYINMHNTMHKLMNNMHNDIIY